jgi:hypothetical protein
MGAPTFEEIVRTVCRSRGIQATEGQIARIAYKGERAGHPAAFDVLEVEIAALDAAHLDRLIAERERELEVLRERRRALACV